MFLAAPCHALSQIHPRLGLIHDFVAVPSSESLLPGSPQKPGSGHTIHKACSPKWFLVRIPLVTPYCRLPEIGPQGPGSMLHGLAC